MDASNNLEPCQVRLDGIQSNGAFPPRYDPSLSIHQLPHLTDMIVPLSNDSLVRLASKPSAEFAEKVENPDIDTQKPYLTPNFTFPTLIEQLYKGHDPPLA